MNLYQCQVYVHGHTLHFALPPGHREPSPHFSGMALQLTRALTVAQGVTVIVQSCLPHHKRSFTVQYPTQQATALVGRATR